MNATPGQARDLQAEQDHAEFRGWMNGNGYDFDDDSYQAEAFAAGMQAARDLAAVTGDGTLHSRITRLAETWRSHPQLTEEGQMLRELGEILGDELRCASDRSAEPEAAPGESSPLGIKHAVTSNRLGHALAALREIAGRTEGSGQGLAIAAHGIARNALDDDAAIRDNVELTREPQPAPEQAKVLAEHAQFMDEILLNANDEPHIGEADEDFAIRYVRYLEDLAGKLTDLVAEGEPLSVKPADDVQPAPELAAAKPDLRTAWRLADERRELLDEIGVMAANAPEDGDSFAVLEEIAMRIAAHGVPEEGK